MPTGKLKWYNPTKRFGFITPDEESDKDVFLHVSALEVANITELQEGQSLQYDIGDNKGKETAINISKIDTTQ
jgi:CspA family cold shock protein|tara:strand:- start:254 stop:472 length:219 start_codon:yes stop_codon:yes gene_type:complete